MQPPTSTDPESPLRNGEGDSSSRASQIGERAAAAIDARRDTVASGFDSAASSLRDRAESLPGGEKIVRAAESAADAMESAADYVRDQDVRDMLTDVKQIVKRHPGATLLIAAALGLLLARTFSRR